MGQQALITVRKVVRPDGTLWPLVLSNGFPSPLPNLWLLDFGDSLARNTLEAYARDVAWLYESLHREHINIDYRLSQMRGFRKAELTTIANYLTITKNGKPAAHSTTVRRFESVRLFIEYCFDHFTEMQNLSLLEQVQAEKNKNRLLKTLTKKIKFRLSECSSFTPSTALTTSQQTLISLKLSVDHPSNPFSKKELKLRNLCIYEVALATLARRSEIVLLELTDLTLDTNPTILIKKPTPNNKNKRHDGASLKTRGRKVPITNELASLLIQYVSTAREVLLQDGTPSLALFLSNRDGRRLSSNSLNKILSAVEVSIQSPDNRVRVHPHGLRATAANNIRRKMTDNGLDGEELTEVMSYLGGWVQGSQMVQKYSRDALAERLAKILRDEHGE